MESTSSEPLSLESTGNSARQKLLSQKMVSVARLAGHIGHDLNNIVSALILGIQLLEKDILNISEGPAHLEGFKKVSERLKRLSATLSLIKGVYPTKPEALDVNIELEKLRTSLLFQLPVSSSNHGPPFSDQAGANQIATRQDTNLCSDDLQQSDIKLILNLSSENLVIYTDRLTFHSLIASLFSNAKESLENGGEITISTQSFSATIDSPKKVLISMSDTGHGITKSIEDNIFDPFFTTKEGKAGMGLTSLYSIVDQMEGSIAYTTDINKGTTFRVYLPAYRNK